MFWKNDQNTDIPETGECKFAVAEMSTVSWFSS